MQDKSSWLFYALTGGCYQGCKMWIRNRFLLPSWIRIRIQYAAPDPGEENFAEKSKKSKEIGSICNFMFKKEVNLDKLPVLGF